MIKYLFKNRFCYVDIVFISAMVGVYGAYGLWIAGLVGLLGIVLVGLVQHYLIEK